MAEAKLVFTDEDGGTIKIHTENAASEIMKRTPAQQAVLDWFKLYVSLRKVQA